MRKIFTEPTKPEELYEFFTYGLSLDPLDWRLHWWVNSTYNTIRRRLWYVETTRHSVSATIEYQAGSKKTDKSWNMHVHK